MPRFRFAPLLLALTAIAAHAQTVSPADYETAQNITGGSVVTGYGSALPGSTTTYTPGGFAISRTPAVATTTQDTTQQAARDQQQSFDPFKSDAFAKAAAPASGASAAAAASDDLPLSVSAGIKKYPVIFVDGPAAPGVPLFHAPSVANSALNVWGWDGARMLQVRRVLLSTGMSERSIAFEASRQTPEEFDDWTQRHVSVAADAR